MTVDLLGVDAIGVATVSHAAARPVDPVAPAAPDPGDRERQFAEMQALARIGSWELEAATGRTRYSDELCRILGRPVGFEATWDEFRAVVHPDDLPALDEAHRRALEGSANGVPFRILRPDGEVRHVYGRRRGQADGEGRIVHLYGTIQDVTAQHEAERDHHEAQTLFATAFDQAPIGMALVGLDGGWLKVNAALLRILGRPEDELLASTFQDITHPEDLDADLADLERLVAGEITGYAMEKRYLTPDGEPIWVHLSVSLARDQAGEPMYFISQIKDINDRKRTEGRLRDAEREAVAQRDYAQAIIGAMHDGYALTAGGEIVAVNEALCALTGFAESELVGSRVPFPFWPPERMDETLTTRRRVVAEEGGSFEITLMRKSGERFEAEVTARPARDANGKVLGFVNTMRDISVQRRQQAELERLARTDALTGLANRHVLQDALAEACARARRSAGQVALVLLDVDYFKQINDGYGHPVGDAVLVEVAARLSGTVRAGEVLARVGGEEFAWLLPDASLDDAIVAADRARSLISGLPFAVAGPQSVSAGVGVIREPEDSDAVYRLADRALYDAKQAGRNRTGALTVAGTA